ncbi:hypothetical protein [Streptomyces rubellomurinus]|uniref:Uncharacterized protein n=1 Tax=Streptomyces sp. Y1 TaxID=3238634 RepID=A0AB39TWK8_9ACTN|nr:hypothetical protein [Streptomyces rubellomurinus]
MAIHDAAPVPPRPALQACPSCGLTDRARGVPAVHLAERQQVTVRTRGEHGHTETRELVSALGRALAPAPPRGSVLGRTFGVLGVLTGMGAAFTFIERSVERDSSDVAKTDFSPPAWATHGNGLPTGHVVFGPNGELIRPDDAPAPQAVHLAEAHDGLVPVWVSVLLVVAAVALLAAAVALHVARRRRLAGQPAAERLWRQAWYCDRCGCAYFPPTAGQGAGALDLAEFRRAVWTAGGYGDLADRYLA